jgi:hypothetical protein
MAQAGSVEVEASIPFEFFVAKKLYPAGTYTIIRHTSDGARLQLAGSDGKHLISLAVLTRLARQYSGNVAKASLVFDVLGGQNYLSEIWLPEVDGYQVSTTTEIHKHAIVEVKE